MKIANYTHFVRIRSSGASARAVIAAAPRATPKDAHGYGESSMEGTAPAIIPASGRFIMADRTPRIQLSSVVFKTAYTKVVFVPFQTPHAASFCHNWPITSITESGRLMSNWWVGEGGGRVGDGEGDEVW